VTISVTTLLAAPGATTRALGGGSFLLGLFLGFLAGIAFQFMRRAWTDLVKTRALLPGLRKTAWGHTKKAVLWMGLVAFLIIFAVSWVINTNAATVPTPAPASVQTTTPPR
jgi:hypothetical protein